MTSNQEYEDDSLDDMLMSEVDMTKPEDVIMRAAPRELLQPPRLQTPVPWLHREQQSPPREDCDDRYHFRVIELQHHHWRINRALRHSASVPYHRPQTILKPKALKPTGNAYHGGGSVLCPCIPYNSEARIAKAPQLLMSPDQMKQPEESHVEGLTADISAMSLNIRQDAE